MQASRDAGAVNRALSRGHVGQETLHFYVVSVTIGTIDMPHRDH